MAVLAFTNNSARGVHYKSVAKTQRSAEIHAARIEAAPHLAGEAFGEGVIRSYVRSYTKLEKLLAHDTFRCGSPFYKQTTAIFWPKKE